MEGATGSTVPRRQLGRYLRDLRGQARFTVRAAAAALEWSEAKIWRIETGQTSMRSLDVEQMCRVYGAPADLTASLMALAKETKTKGWWHAYGDVIPEGFDVYIGLEEAASQLHQYSGTLVPGLLQTPEYARSLIRLDNQEVSEEEIERRVQIRVKRQSLLTRSTPPTMNVALSEAALRSPVGGADVMAGQLERLAEVNKLGNVSVRVMPFAAGLNYGMLSGSFVMLRFPEGGAASEPTTVYVEGYTGALYLDKPREVGRFEQAFRSIWEMALSEPESTRFFRQVAKELPK